MLEEELGPGVAQTLARTAEQLRADMDHLDTLAERAMAALGDQPSLADLAALPTVVRRRVLRLAALRAGAPAGELFHEHVLAVDGLLTDWHGQKWIDLPGHLRVLRGSAGLEFVRHQDNPSSPTP